MSAYTSLLSTAPPASSIEQLANNTGFIWMGSLHRPTQQHNLPIRCHWRSKLPSGWRYGSRHKTTHTWSTDDMYDDARAQIYTQEGIYVGCARLAARTNTSFAMLWSRRWDEHFIRHVVITEMGRTLHSPCCDHGDGTNTSFAMLW